MRPFRLKTALVTGATILTLATLGADAAQAAAMVVYDPTSYAKLIEQAKTALDQLQALKAQAQQDQRLFDSLNQASGVGQVAPELSSLAVRQALPEVLALTAAATGDLSGLGAIGARAGAIRSQSRLYTPAPTDPAGADLDASGMRAARDLAVAESVSAAGSQRAAGLQTLRQAIDTAPSARAVLDLQARAAAEQALIANDQMRLQGLAMAQAAEERLQAQRERERIAAAGQARLAFYRRGFP